MSAKAMTEPDGLPSESDAVPISALQHLVFCERQFALIHLERAWQENLLTVEGKQLHDRVDAADTDSRADLRIARGLPLRCRRLGLTGRADVVEFHRDPDGVCLLGVPGRWRAYPIEYKRGQPKSHGADEIQLCAQTLCLEEMLGTSIPDGALYYGKTRRRKEVAFNAELREQVEFAARRAHDILRDERTPIAMKEPKCDSCSLLEICRPGISARSATGYVEAGIRASLESTGEGVKD